MAVTSESSEQKSGVYWSIGLIPVQEWIAEARRSRDLGAGSALLSWTMAKVIDEVKKKLGAIVWLGEEETAAASLKFQENLEKGGYSIPNRASGCIEGKGVREVASCFGGLQENVVDAAWATVLQEIRDCHGTFGSQEIGKDIWAQLETGLGEDEPSPLQLVWCVQGKTNGVSCSNLPSREGLDTIERLYAAVKRSRPVRAHTGAPVRKCGQCGRRESMGGEDPEEWSQFAKKIEDLLSRGGGQRIDAGELLCSICARKRLAGYLVEGVFPSTSEIAARIWLDRIKDVADLKALLSSLTKAIRQVPGYEGRRSDIAPLYYRRTVKRLLSRPREDRNGSLKKVDGCQLGLRAAILEAHKSGKAEDLRIAPSNYLAVVTFDGDDMGPAVRRHLQHLPEAIRCFASDVDGIAKENKAHTFYVGGDEGLLLCPIESLLDLVHDLRAQWRERATIYPASGGEMTTLSVGAALFDRERPLGAAIRSAYGAIENAKALDGKNGLTIAVETASGNAWAATAHWRDWERVRAAVKAVRDGRLAMAWPYEIERFLNDLPVEMWERGNDLCVEAVRAELRRLTDRKCIGNEGRGATEDERRCLWDAIKGGEWWPRSPSTSDRHDLANQLHLVAFLVREFGVGRQEEIVSAKMTVAEGDIA